VETVLAEFVAPDGMKPPPDDQQSTLEVLQSEGFVLAEEDAESIVAAAVTAGQVFWGPVGYNGGFVDATSWFTTPISGSVRSVISFYATPTSGQPLASSGWYTHNNVTQGTNVGRRWRGYIPPAAALAMAWWVGGGVYASPFKRLHW
jgi:hypothetical protein